MNFLDCTLRDGGYYNKWDFSYTLIRQYLEAMLAAGVDIVELGLRSLDRSGFKGASAFTTDEFIRSLDVPAQLKVSVMINASELLAEVSLTTALASLFESDRECSPVDIVRIACHVHEFERALPAANWLKEKGYTVGFNLMQIADRSEVEIRNLAKAAAASPLDVLYFADSMGSMNPEQTAQIIGWLRKHWNGPLGIHTHDNMGLALSNTLRAIDEGVTWVDATVTGMGRGPGNARTEELAIELAELRLRSINMVPLMGLVRNHFRPMQQQYGWGTNPYYYLAGKHGIHPTYIQEMLGDTRYSEEDVLAVIDHLKREGGKKYNPSTLDVARHFYQGEAKGNWSPVTVFSGREMLLLGTGPGVHNHRIAIESLIRKRKPVVVALNTQAAIDADLIDYRVACHPVRLLADCAAYGKLPQPLITPFAMLPKDVRNSLDETKILDFGINVQKGMFAFHEEYCVLPTSLVAAYALAIASSGGAKKVFLAGFDGFSADDPRNIEMDRLLIDYQNAERAIPLLAITPTRYRLPETSVYSVN
ncbi:aldolase catalytic domain-containing protein [Stutzerimonas stutzeri]|uniref:aldolase catalytic domain-containing protein n=1 Tax=Stutzerimonas stutzeri TaxID=316 RepID=UPI000F79FAC0|nr:aldolase catalytic domain-containing protein [Stutzerimonas stutzeri]RRV87699.1 aldolase [Stutzerimonas stutzeri]